MVDLQSIEDYVKTKYVLSGLQEDYNGLEACICNVKALLSSTKETTNYLAVAWCKDLLVKTDTSEEVLLMLVGWQNSLSIKRLCRHHTVTTSYLDIVRGDRVASLVKQAETLNKGNTEKPQL